jgi:transcriptional regulator with XRE-family HTH domain
MIKNNDKSGSYDESDAATANRTERPIPSPGIGRRISEAADRLGTRTSAYKVMGVSSAALQRYIKEENSPPFDALARLCVATSVSLDWLATGEGEVLTEARQAAPLQSSQPLRRQDLTLALQLAAEALGNKVLPLEKHAELVMLLYELLEEGVPQAKVLRFARAAM